MQSSILIAAASLSLVLSPSNAWAKTLTKADLEGKKICWGSNDYKMFEPGGKVWHPMLGEGTWSINKAGVVAVSFPHGVAGIVRDLGGGTFEYSGSWLGAPKITADNGYYCN